MTTIELCPVLRPNPQEFENFYDYMESIEKKYSSQYGMVKIIPPKCFKARQQDYTKSLDNLTVQGPIEQNVYGKGGIYECLYIQKKSLMLRDFKKKQIDTDQQRIGNSMEQIENEFWKNLAFSPPLYGADIKVSLMDSTSQWNFNNIKSILSEGLQKKISGVNEPYIYIGSWKSFFAWHKEDMDLNSTNYLHVGRPKVWYCIRETDGHHLEAFARSNFAEHFNKCSEHLRHKTTMINPYLLKQKIPQLQISKMQQNEGEFIFLFGAAYHAGFNCGFNIAEAVNYATLKWLDLITKAKSCKCVGYSVSINVHEFCQNMLKGQFQNSPSVLEMQNYINQNYQKQKVQDKKKSTVKKVIKKKKVILRQQPYQLNISHNRM